MLIFALPSFVFISNLCLHNQQQIIMSFLVGLLLFLGVISSESEFDPDQEQYYTETYASDDNVESYRQHGPYEEDEW